MAKNEKYGDLLQKVAETEQNRYGDLLENVKNAETDRYGSLAAYCRTKNFSAAQTGDATRVLDRTDISRILAELVCFKSYAPLTVFGDLIGTVKDAVEKVKAENTQIPQSEMNDLKKEIPRFLKRGLTGAAFVIGRHEGKPCAFIYSSEAEAQEIISHNPRDGLRLTNFKGFTEAVGSAWQNIDNYNLLRLPSINVLVFTS